MSQNNSAGPPSRESVSRAATEPASADKFRIPLRAEAIVREVRKRAARHQETTKNPDEGPGFPDQPIRWETAVTGVVAKKEYTLSELLMPADEAFVASAYRAVLRREPDRKGFEHFLNSLRSGEMSKVEILAALRWSPEGKARSVHVDGLLIPRMLHAWRRKRFIGPVLAWVHSLLRLGSMSQRYQVSEAAIVGDLHRLGGVVNHLSLEIHSKLQSLGELIMQQEQQSRSALSVLTDRLAVTADEASALSAHLEQSMGRLGCAQDELMKSVASSRAEIRHFGTRLDERVGQLKADQAKISDFGMRLDERIGQMKADHVRSEQGAEERLKSIHAQLEVLQSLPESLLHLQQSIFERLQQTRDDLRVNRDRLAEHAKTLSGYGEELETHRSSIQSYDAVLAASSRSHEEKVRKARALDPLYVAFEDTFRGGKEVVRARAEPYLDLIRAVGAGGTSAPVLDLGCGRGEWLDLLRENGLQARGVDSNSLFVNSCRGRGLDVIEGDVIAIMRSLEEGSVGAITGMHIAEHLPFEVLVELIDQAGRLLRAGGLLALETPNPENLQVASHFFYLDPTHRNPLPPEALKWLVGARGLERARIERWTIAREMNVPPLLDEHVPGAGSINMVLSQFSAAPDYAVIAYKGGQ